MDSQGFEPGIQNCELALPITNYQYMYNNLRP